MATREAAAVAAWSARRCAGGGLVGGEGGGEGGETRRVARAARPFS